MRTVLDHQPFGLAFVPVELYLEVLQCVYALPHPGEGSSELTVAKRTHRNLRNGSEPFDYPKFAPSTRPVKIPFLHWAKSLLPGNLTTRPRPNTRRRIPCYRGANRELSEEYPRRCGVTLSDTLRFGNTVNSVIGAQSRCCVELWRQKARTLLPEE